MLVPQAEQCVYEKLWLRVPALPLKPLGCESPGLASNFIRPKNSPRSGSTVRADVITVFWARVPIGTFRVLTNVQRIYGPGRLGKTGYLSILPSTRVRALRRGKASEKPDYFRRGKQS